MKQFRNTPYYLDKDGNIYRHYPPYQYRCKKTGWLKQNKPEKYSLVKGSYRNDGYLQVSINMDGVKGKYLKHRVVAEVLVPGYFEGAHVDHIDCNKSNNHPSNLQWCTKEYNHKKGNNPNYLLFAQY